MNPFRSFSVLLAPVLLAAAPASACVSLPAVLSDGMVLQQRTEAALWGRTERREVPVVTSWDGRRHVARADAQGRWSLRVPTPAAGGPYEITFCPGEAGERSLRDVLAGEVWLASGQSNMGFTLAPSAGAETDVPAADHPAIRFFRVARQIAKEPLEDVPGTTWVPSSPDTAGSFSAVAYHFARVLHRERGVPVGIIESSWGGSTAEAWTPRPVLAADPRLSHGIERWARWQRDTASADEQARRDAVYQIDRPHREPGVLFYGMIRPVLPYTIQGFLWYQGEADASVRRAREYRHLLGNIVRGWREAWGAQDLPFYIVQLPPWRYGDMHAASVVREAQQDAADAMSGVEMLSIMDLGDMENIHPTRKREVGERLAWLALARTYGVPGAAASGPSYRSVVIEHGRIRVHFDHAEGGLVSSGSRLAGFEISGRDAPDAFLPARARIEGGGVVVWSDEVPAPVAVRYGWGEAVAVANLFNGAGLPAAPFRTGSREDE